PVKPGELILGKMLPYLVLTLLEFCLIALVMRTVFQVPIHGYFVTLLGLALPFVLSMLAVGLWSSPRASPRAAAMHLTTATLLPSIVLSGYVFPLDSMPWVFQKVAWFLPTTWLVDASQGVILRGAGWPELWHNALALWGMAVLLMTVSSLWLRKRLA